MENLENHGILLIRWNLDLGHGKSWKMKTIVLKLGSVSFASEKKTEIRIDFPTNNWIPMALYLSVNRYHDILKTTAIS